MRMNTRVGAALERQVQPKQIKLHSNIYTANGCGASNFICVKWMGATRLHINTFILVHVPPFTARRDTLACAVRGRKLKICVPFNNTLITVYYLVLKLIEIYSNVLYMMWQRVCAVRDSSRSSTFHSVWMRYKLSSQSMLDENSIFPPLFYKPFVSRAFTVNPFTRTHKRIEEINNGTGHTR